METQSLENDENAARLLYRLAPLEGKGIATFATQDIAVGEVIVEEKPVVRRTFGQRMDPQILADLSSENRDAIMALCDCWMPNGVKSLDTIMDTNALSLGDGSGRSVLCVTISRFNHSCVPNVAHTFNTEEGTKRVVASRHIANGEELCLPYIEIFAPREARMKELRVGYNFTCTCSACALSPEESARSDDRRMRAKQVNASIASSMEEDPKAAVELMKEYFILLKEEQLTGS
eukprot:GEMP01096186.1.p1 GENE.GEMP01096186.1~~GEMP01096186.1.p1  ORF type:complete len:233 (+),score=82.85 GEMP01096186.1:119-817(+)